MSTVPQPPTAPLAMLLCGALASLGASESGHHWQLLFGFDNDFFTEQDDYYSNGIFLGSGVLGAEAEDLLLPRLYRGAAAALPGIDVDGRHVACGWSLVQRVFTPEDLGRSDRIENDIAYSGQLLINASIAAEDARWFRSWTLSLGVTGPLSGAEALQTAGHKIFPAQEPQGWEHQVDNEPLLGLNHQIRHCLWSTPRGGWNADLIPGASLSLGNLATAAEASLTLRAGYHVPADYRIPGPMAGDPAVALLTFDPDNGDTAVYAFAQANAALVGYHVAWDGNWGDDPAEIDYDRANARLSAGLVYTAHRISLTGRMTWATIPWDNPAGRTHDIFGSIAIDCVL